MVSGPQDDGVIEQIVFHQVVNDRARLLIYVVNVVVHLGNRAPHIGGVGIVGRHGDRVRVGDGGNMFGSKSQNCLRERRDPWLSVGGLGRRINQSTLMGCGQIKHGEKGLTGGDVATRQDLQVP